MYTPFLVIHTSTYITHQSHCRFASMCWICRTHSCLLYSFSSKRPEYLKHLNIDSEGTFSSSSSGQIGKCLIFPLFSPFDQVTLFKQVEGSPMRRALSPFPRSMEKVSISFLHHTWWWLPFGATFPCPGPQGAHGELPWSPGRKASLCVLLFLEQWKFLQNLGLTNMIEVPSSENRAVRAARCAYKETLH